MRCRSTVSFGEEEAICFLTSARVDLEEERVRLRGKVFDAGLPGAERFSMVSLKDMLSAVRGVGLGVMERKGRMESEKERVGLFLAG